MKFRNLFIALILVFVTMSCITVANAESGAIYNFEDAETTVIFELLDETKYKATATNKETSDEIVINGTYILEDDILTVFVNNKQFDKYVINGSTLTVYEDIEEPNQPIEEEEKPRVHTVLSRISEWFNNNFLKFISTTDFIGTIACFVMVFLEKMGNKKHKESILADLSVNTKTISDNTISNDKVLDVVNALISAQNEHEKKELSRDELARQNTVFLKSLMQILVTVYVNNKNLPQATKDLVNLEYVKALRSEKVEEEVGDIPSEV